MQGYQHMLARTFTQKWSNVKPQLVTHYENATWKVFHYKFIVHKTYYSKFAVTEDDLRQMGIDPREYSYTVASLLKRWCETKKFDHIPINVFLGPWAMKKYLKVVNQRSVVIQEPDVIDKVELMYNEQLFANSFIYRNTHSINYVREMDIVADLKPFLSQSWLDMYHQDEIMRLPYVQEVLNRLCKRYRIDRDSVSSYWELLIILP